MQNNDSLGNKRGENNVAIDNDNNYTNINTALYSENLCLEVKLLKMINQLGMPPTFLAHRHATYLTAFCFFYATLGSLVMNPRVANATHHHGDSNRINSSNLPN